jgi:hypothetical protein
MMDIIFEILCGCLYVIGLCLGWDYKEASVNICIYLVAYNMRVVHHSDHHRALRQNIQEPT